MRQAKLLQMVAKQLNINSIIFHGRFSATERSVHSSPFRRRPALVLSTSTLYQIDFSRFFGHVDEHLTSTSIKFFVMMPRRNGMLCFEALSISEKCTKKDRGAFCPRSWELNIHFQNGIGKKCGYFRKSNGDERRGKGDAIFQCPPFFKCLLD